MVDGNIAAMRAVLESLSENLAMHVRCGRFVAPGDHVSFPISEAEAYIRDIQAALAAPPRNCDRFATANDAANAWQAYSVVHRDRDYSLMAAFVWLLAPAEGGAE